MEDRKRIWILIGPPGLFLLLLFLIPLSTLALESFRDSSGELISLEQYIFFLTNASFLRVFFQSIGVAFWVAVLAVLLAYPVAYYLAFQAGRLQVALMTLIIIPAWTSYLLRIISWKVVLGSDGLINSLLLWLHLVDQAVPIFLYSPQAVIITLVYVWIPFAALPIFVALDRMDRNLLEAAADLGCAPWETFLRVTLPLSFPGVIASLIYVFVPTLGEYVTPMLVGGAKGGTLFGNLIQDHFMRGLNWPLGSAMSIILILNVLVMLYLLSRLLRRWVQV